MVPLVAFLALLLLAAALCIGGTIGAWYVTQPRSVFGQLQAVVPLVFEGLAAGLHPVEALRQAGLVAAAAMSLPPPARPSIVVDAVPNQSSLAVLGLTAMGGYLVRRPRGNRT